MDSLTLVNAQETVEAMPVVVVERRVGILVQIRQATVDAARWLEDLMGKDVQILDSRACLLDACLAKGVLKILVSALEAESPVVSENFCLEASLRCHGEPTRNALSPERPEEFGIR